MKKEDLIILFIGILLVVAMLITFFFGGDESKHGVGSLVDPVPTTGFPLASGIYYQCNAG